MISSSLYQSKFVVHESYMAIIYFKFKGAIPRNLIPIKSWWIHLSFMKICYYLSYRLLCWIYALWIFSPSCGIHNTRYVNFHKNNKSFVILHFNISHYCCCYGRRRRSIHCYKISRNEHIFNLYNSITTTTGWVNLASRICTISYAFIVCAFCTHGLLLM